MKAQNQHLQDTILDLQCRSMKNNLIFTGLGGDNRDENVEAKLRSFIYKELMIDNVIHFGSVHRFGISVGNRPRPIVARFLYHNDLVHVKSRAHLLKGKPFGISEQFPAAIEDRRKELYPLVKQLKRKGNHVKLVRDRLYVNGQLYKGDDITENTSVKVPVTDTQNTEMRQDSDSNTRPKDNNARAHASSNGPQGTDYGTSVQPGTADTSGPQHMEEDAPPVDPPPHSS